MMIEVVTEFIVVGVGVVADILIIFIAVGHGLAVVVLSLLLV